MTSLDPALDFMYISYKVFIHIKGIALGRLENEFMVIT